MKKEAVQAGLAPENTKNALENEAGGSAAQHTALSAKKGLIILAHGSRDPAWRSPFEALAQQLRKAQGAGLAQPPFGAAQETTLEVAPEAAPQAANLQVACAYLQLCEPDLPTAARALRQAGCTHIAIAPMFLGLGTHIREDLPQLLAQLQAQHSACSFSLLPVLGDSAAMQSLMAQHLLAGLQTVFAMPPA